MIDLKEIFKKYSIPDTSIIEKYYNEFHIRYIKDNTIVCSWIISECDENGTHGGITLLKHKFLGIPPSSNRYIKIIKNYYTTIDSFIQLHNENGPAIETYIDHKLTEIEYYINDKKLNNEVVEANPEILKDNMLRKIIL